MRFIALFVLLAVGNSRGQPKPDIDSLYITRFKLANDFRTTFTTQRYQMEFGTKQGKQVSGLFNNVSEWLGFGLTYKFIDFDLAFSLPKTRVLDAGLQNLEQFRLTGSFSGRRYTVRGYWLESSGMVVADAGGAFISLPTVQVRNIGIEYTHYFNFRRYSFRAATFQNEQQRRRAGSLMVRVEPFFRKVGIGDPVVPPAQDLAAVYGEQAGLRYAQAPVLLVLPGYGRTWTWGNGQWFVSPMLFLGGGIAFNAFRGNAGEKHAVNVEWKGSAMLNAGYNGTRFYVSLRSYYIVDYFLLDPSYFMMTDLRLGITAGYRFRNLERLIPEL